MAMPELLMELPTAVHRMVDVHDTPFKTLAVAPLGLGVICNSHGVPFHTSAKVASVPELFMYLPVAVQAVDDKHDIPYRLPALDPEGLGVV
jgi:hypothetical protein